MLGSFVLYSRLTKKLGGISFKSGSVGSSAKKGNGRCSIVKVCFQGGGEYVMKQQKLTDTKAVGLLCSVWVCCLELKVAVSDGNLGVSVRTPRDGGYRPLILCGRRVTKHMHSFSLRFLTLQMWNWNCLEHWNTENWSVAAMALPGVATLFLDKSTF